MEEEIGDESEGMEEEGEREREEEIDLGQNKVREKVDPFPTSDCIAIEPLINLANFLHILRNQ